MQGFAKVAVASQQAGDKAQSAGSKGSKGFDSLGRAVNGVVSELAAMAGGVVGIQGLITAAKEYENHLNRIADKSDEITKKTIALAALQEPGKAQEAVKRASGLGARYGVDMGRSANTVQLLQSLNNGDLEIGLREAKTAFRLSQLGVDDESLKTIATQASAKNISLQKMGGAFYAAAEISPLDVSDIAKAAPGIASYKDPLTGVSAITAMAAGGVPTGQLQDATKDLGMALAMESDLTKKATKQLKPYGIEYQNLSEIEQLQALRQIIPDLDQSGDLSIPEVMKAGITEQQKARSLAIGINQMATLEQARAAVENVPEDALGRTVERIRAESPEINSSMLADEASATREYQAVYGPEATKARERKLREQDVGLQLIEKGYGRLVDDETGRPGYMGRAFAGLAGVEPTPQEAARGNMYWQSLSLPGSVPYPTMPQREQPTVDSAERLRETLDRTTTSADKLGDAMTGAAAAVSSKKGKTAVKMIEGSFAVGTKRVPHDMVAEIHKDEAIIPAHMNPNNPGAKKSVWRNAYAFAKGKANNVIGGAVKGALDPIDAIDSQFPGYAKYKKEREVFGLPRDPGRIPLGILMGATRGLFEPVKPADESIPQKKRPVTSPRISAAPDPDAEARKAYTARRDESMRTGVDAMRNARNEKLARLAPLPHKEFDTLARNDLDIQAKTLGINPEKASQFRSQWDATFAKQEEPAYAPQPEIQYAPRGVAASRSNSRGQNANSNAWRRNEGQNANVRAWRKNDGQSANFRAWNGSGGDNADSRAWQGEATSGAGFAQSGGAGEIAGISELSGNIRELNRNVMALTSNIGRIQAAVPQAKSSRPVSTGALRSE